MLNTLNWHRVSASMLVVRRIQMAKAHLFSMIQAIVKSTNSVLGDSSDIHVLFHVRDVRHTIQVDVGSRFVVDFLFADVPQEYISRWRDGLHALLSDPVHGRNLKLLALGEIESRCMGTVLESTSLPSSIDELCLDFLSPYPFNRTPGKPRTWLSLDTFIQSILRRLSRLFGRDITAAYNSTASCQLLPYYWRYTEIRHASKTQPGHTQLINGCVGRLYVKGAVTDVLPIILLASELHAGTKIPYSHGYFQLRCPSPPYFQQMLGDRRRLVTVVREVVERHDDAAAALAESEGLPIDEYAVAEKLANELVNGRYTPTPSTAFSVQTHSHNSRTVERLHPRDLIVQQHLFRLISPVLDAAFEDESIGYRRGLSRQHAAERITRAIADGHSFALRADISDFFPSVDHDRLIGLIDSCIPSGDSEMRRLLQSSIAMPYVLNGDLHARKQGLAQGSPLSPVLANLYLDSFDEAIKQADARFIRYADDFLILTKSRDDAEAVLSRAEAILADLGLTLSGSKTLITDVRDGFEFLGMRFDEQEAVTPASNIVQAYRKPLYVTEPDLFLSLSGDSVNVCRGRTILESFPIRRISEIIVLERTGFSTALITRCVDENIPFTIALNTGYFITTIKPDSRRYYNISSRHTAKYASLTDTEQLAVAKEFAANKVLNYIPVYQQRYEMGDGEFIRRLTEFAEQIRSAAHIDEVRGCEGAAAREALAQFGRRIHNPAFRFLKRQRRNPDRINSMLNFGYYMLFSRVNATVRAVGLNPYLGFLHSPLNDYESLVCDIEELFRSRIDRLILRLLNLKMIKESDFRETARGCYLTRDGIHKYIKAFETEMQQKSGRERLSLAQNIYAQTIVVKNWVLDVSGLTFYRWES
ncbi:MAG: CRISPR-associated endonuclease Cas1 [candidate division Zixibacteria bacterium]|jgi:CRISPR-associated protein Cas1|nr:CRISPR-associated endonuclease Cas1 [candidate division Zixibacteria bacterium]